MEEVKIPKKSTDEAEAKEITAILGEFNEGCLYWNWPHCDDIGTLRVYKADYDSYNDDTGFYEENLSGWEYDIYSYHCDKSITKTTNAEGYFEMEIMAGTYNITEIIPSGFEDWYIYEVIIDDVHTSGTAITDNEIDVTISSDEITTVIFVNKENEPPVASISAPTTVSTYGSVTLDASVSNDPDGSIVNYEWDYDNDGIYGEAGAEQTHNGLSSFTINFGGITGPHTFGVQVTDNYGATDATTHTVTVIETT